MVRFDCMTGSIFPVRKQNFEGGMDQFRQVGEILGSLNAFMVLKHDIPINQRQCCLLFDMLELAFVTISDEIRLNLRLEERNTKWKALEAPMKELHLVFKEADGYIRYCLEIKDWWGKAASLHMSRDCTEFHIHNLLCCFPVVIEAIETAAEISGVDQDDMQKRRMAIMKKYDQECEDLNFFQWKFGEQYLVSREVCDRLSMAWKEDRWLLMEKLGEKKTSSNIAKHESRLAELFLRKVNEAETSKWKPFPSQVLVGSHDYYVKRRLGFDGGNLKEIQWLGESFAVKTFYGDIEPLKDEISSVLSLSHPNVLQFHCAFFDEERKEGFLVMELMSKTLSTHMKDHSGVKKRIPFSVPVAVDIMLQVSRGMEYLHSKKMYHGDLNPSNILLKARNASAEGLFLAKVTGFGLKSVKKYTVRSPKPPEIDLDIWLAPEVLADQEQNGSKSMAKHTEKADVYSFGMLSFEVLTGKIPFSDGHLQGEKMTRNIRAGERPLFSSTSPKYLANLIKKCWQTSPNLRPTFSSISRILRYIKKILIINSRHGHPDSPPPLVDYCDMEAAFLKKFHSAAGKGLTPVMHVPFQMFAYKLVEKEKVSGKNWDCVIDRLAVHRAASLCDDEHFAAMDDLLHVSSDQRSVCSEIIDRRNAAIALDLRSVTSEKPPRKLFSLDQRSIGSESPGRKRFVIASVDHKSIDQPSLGAKTLEQGNSRASLVDRKADSILVLENKTDGKTTFPKLKVEILDNVSMSKAADSSHDNSKSALAKVNGKMLEKPEIMAKKLVSKLVNEQKIANYELSEVKLSPRSTTHHKLAEIPEKKILLSEPDSVSCQLPRKANGPDKTGRSKNKQQKSCDLRINVRKPVLVKKPKDSEIKLFSESLRNESPRSSPARTKKMDAFYSACSSPARDFKACSPSRRATIHASKEYPSPMREKVDHISLLAESMRNDLPGSSPARKKTMNSLHSPSSSPARDFHFCSPPRGARVYPQKECPSPLNPCTRCSRIDRQSSLPPAVGSPGRPKTGHTSR